VQQHALELLSEARNRRTAPAACDTGVHSAAAHGLRRGVGLIHSGDGGHAVQRTGSVRLRFASDSRLSASGVLRSVTCIEVVTLNYDRSAALVVRVWLEGETGQFRSRLTTGDTSPGSAFGDEVTVAVVSSPRELMNAVSDWLQEFTHDAPKRIDSE
jgi:hypothetical protein